MMKPNVYIAYLCFIDENLSRKFEKWSWGTASHNELKYAIEDAAFKMRRKAATMHIYALDMAWREFSYDKFIEFLTVECGFTRRIDKHGARF